MFSSSYQKKVMVQMEGDRQKLQRTQSITSGHRHFGNPYGYGLSPCRRMGVVSSITEVTAATLPFVSPTRNGMLSWVAESSSSDAQMIFLFRFCSNIAGSYRLTDAMMNTLCVPLLALSIYISIMDTLPKSLRRPWGKRSSAFGLCVI